jgi:hypothetical protein
MIQSGSGSAAIFVGGHTKPRLTAPNPAEAHGVARGGVGGLGADAFKQFADNNRAAAMSGGNLSIDDE